MVVIFLSGSCAEYGTGICEPGDRRDCTCQGGNPGLQRCLEGGFGWAECDCSCQEDCSFIECGPDPVCGYSCGTCRDGESCDEDGICRACIDLDQDGYGEGPDCISSDCNDQDPMCWVGACCTGDCYDSDGDGFGSGPDCPGLDCNDNDASCWEGACCESSGCLDLDGDGFGLGDDCLGPDCKDEDAYCWIGACCSPEIDLSGTWAERICHNEEYDTTLGTERGTRVTFNRIEIEHIGRVLSERLTVCEVMIPQMGVIQMTFPHYLVSSLSQRHREVTLAYNETGAVYRNPERPDIQLIGWHPWSDDPENEDLPEDVDDPRVYDQDGDGHPGATANVYVDITSGIECDIYIASRDVLRYDGAVVSPHEISGDLEAETDQVTLDSTNMICTMGYSTTPMPGGTFKRVRLPDPDISCVDIVANMDSIFGGPCPVFP